MKSNTLRLSRSSRAWRLRSVPEWIWAVTPPPSAPSGIWPVPSFSQGPSSPRSVGGPGNLRIRPLVQAHWGRVALKQQMPEKQHHTLKGAICNSDTVCLRWVLQSKFTILESSVRPPPPLQTRSSRVLPRSGYEHEPKTSLVQHYTRLYHLWFCAVNVLNIAPLKHKDNM